MFFLPFMTSIQTRYNSFSKVTVYCITYVIPEFLIVLLQNHLQNLFAEKLYIIFILSFVSFVNLYEVGYIYNETETIKHESDPTKRLSDRQLTFYERHKPLIYGERIILTIALNVVLSLFISKQSLMLFSAEELLCMAVFFLYNTVRGGRISQVIYFFLSVLKYIAPVFCYSERMDMGVILACVFVFPIVRTMEYKAHYGSEVNTNLFFRKHIIKYDVNRIPVFRVIATLCLLVISILMGIIGFCSWLPSIMCAYMFLYRLALWGAVHMGAQFKGYLKR